VRKGAEKLAKSLNAKQQGRLDGFFTATPNTSAPKKAAAKAKEVKGKGTKRKVSPPALCNLVRILTRLQSRRKTRRNQKLVKSRRLKSDS
jgi:hypothetical protein